MATTKKSPVGKSPVGKSPVGKSPAGKSPAGKSPVGKSPAGKSPAGKSPTKKAADKAPAKAQVIQPIYQQSKIDWRSLYLYAVCLITLMVCLFSLVSFIRSGVNLAYPDPAYVDPYATAPKVNSVVIAAQVKDQNQRQAVKSMIDAVTTLIIAGPLYLYHWRLARK